MQSILRAQQDYEYEHSVMEGGSGSGCLGTLLPPLALPPPPESKMRPSQPPRSPDNRLTRVSSRSSTHRSIDIPVIYENPCQPCRPRFLPSPRRRDPTSLCARIRGWAPYISLCCFITILVWELYSLHTEVYRLRVAESAAYHASAASSGSALRRMHNDNAPHLRATAAGGSTSGSGSSTGPTAWTFDGRGDFRFDSHAPLPPPPPLPGNPRATPRTLNAAAAHAPAARPPPLEDDGRGERAAAWATAEAQHLTDTEKRLAELMATRDLLRSTGRRKVPDPGPLPDYMQL